jgi:hypothetical protein
LLLRGKWREYSRKAPVCQLRRWHGAVKTREF